MMDNQVGAKSRFVYGLRVEQYDLKLSTLTTNNLVSQNFTDVLPSVNYTYSINEKIMLSAAVESALNNKVTATNPSGVQSEFSGSTSQLSTVIGHVSLRWNL